MESSERLDTSEAFETWSVVSIVANVTDTRLLVELQEVLGNASLKGIFSSGRREGSTLEASLWFRSASQAIDGATNLFRQLASFPEASSLVWGGGVATGEGSPLIPEHENSLLQRVRYFAHAASDGQCLVARSTFEIVKTVSLGLYGLEELGVLEGSESIVGEHAFQLIGPDITGSLASSQIRDYSINTLPFLGGCFLGRHQEKDEISVLLRTKRIVTLLGAPGVGKSALAQRVCAELIHSSIEGVIYVDLSLVNSRQQFVEALMSAFRMGAAQPANVISKISSFMRGRS